MIASLILIIVTSSSTSSLASREKRNDDVSVGDLQTLIQQQAATIQQQAAMLQALQTSMAAADSTNQRQETTINNLQTQLSAVQARQNRNVAFTATFVYGTQPINIGEHGIVKFNNVITNIGGAYNAVMGTFTAPIAGTYAFFFSGQTDNTHDATFWEINKNGNSILCMTVMEGPAHDWYDKGTCFGLSHLNAGDQVFARHYLGGTYLNENQFSSFSGFLVQAD